MSGSLLSDDCIQFETTDEDSLSSISVKDSAAYADHGLFIDLHPAFANASITFDRTDYCFAAELEDTSEEGVLSASQKAFTNALGSFQQGVKPQIPGRSSCKSYLERSNPVNRQVGNIYLAIIDGLQHILEWYKRAAGMKHLASAVERPAYAETLRKKMLTVETAAQAMSERADEPKQVTS
ncbi:MAG: hypothetical protein Q9220_001800 [cf. Caloplaca sp. 1 TL-2023]